MKFLRLKEVIAITALSRSSIYKFMSEQRFPQSISLGDRAVAWIETEIEEWMEEKLQQREPNNSVVAKVWVKQ